MYDVNLAEFPLQYVEQENNTAATKKNVCVFVESKPEV